jgi:hypothetical protein
MLSTLPIYFVKLLGIKRGSNFLQFRGRGRLTHAAPVVQIKDCLIVRGGAKSWWFVSWHYESSHNALRICIFPGTKPCEAHSNDPGSWCHIGHHPSNRSTFLSSPSNSSLFRLLSNVPPMSTRRSGNWVLSLPSFAIVLLPASCSNVVAPAGSHRRYRSQLVTALLLDDLRQLFLTY